MWLYITLFFVFVFCFLGIKNKNNQISLFYFLSFVLILMSGLRRDVGTDTIYGYKELFSYIKHGYNVSGYIEYGWIILNKISIKCGFGYNGVLLFSAALSIFPIMVVVRQSKVNPLFALAIYYGMYLYFHSFNMIRQCIAMSLCILSFHYYLNSFKLKALLWFCLAFLFHESSLCFLVIIPFLKVKLSINTVSFLLILTIVIGYFGAKFLLFFTGDYSHYFNPNSSFGFRKNTFVILLMTVLANIVFFFMVFCNPKMLKNEPYLHLLLLGYCCMNVTMCFGLGTRLMFYFTQAQIIFYPRYFQCRLKNKQLLLLFFLMYLFMNFVRILYGQSEDMCPYKSILFH